MSKTNIAQTTRMQLLRRLNRLGNERDVDATLAALDDEIEVITPFSAVNGEPRPGAAAHQRRRPRARARQRR